MAKSKTTILHGNGINWSWYMHVVTHGDYTCTVEREYRVHRDEPAAHHPETVGHYDVVEREGKRALGETFPPRIATAIEITRVNAAGLSTKRTYKLRGGPVARWSFPQ